jgi:septal ring factor EnvC (AmiA/AmiB activator)
MRILLLIAFCSFFIPAFSQDIKQIENNSRKVRDNMKEIEQQRASLDSINKELNSSIEKSISKTDSILRAEDVKRMTENSGNYFLQLQREQARAQKKKMWLYFGMGGAFLAVFIAGMMRRAKK